MACWDTQIWWNDIICLLGFGLKREMSSFLCQPAGMLLLCERAQAGLLEGERVHGESSLRERKVQVSKLRSQSCK